MRCDLCGHACEMMLAGCFMVLPVLLATMLLAADEPGAATCEAWRRVSQIADGVLYCIDHQGTVKCFPLGR